MEQLMHLGPIEEDLDLSNNVNEQTHEKIRMFFEFEEGIC